MHRVIGNIFVFAQSSGEAVSFWLQNLEGYEMNVATEVARRF